MRSTTECCSTFTRVYKLAIDFMGVEQPPSVASGAPQRASKWVSESEMEDEPLCPITLERPLDPVIASDGHTYERWALARWRQKNNNSPMTRQPFEPFVYENDAVREWLVKRVLQRVCDLDCKCPLTDPVVASDGRTYERQNAEALVKRPTCLPRRASLCLPT